MTINYQSYIVRDPAICGGEAVVRGTRVTVRTVLASLAEGMSVAEIGQTRCACLGFGMPGGTLFYHPRPGLLGHSPIPTRDTPGLAVGAPARTGANALLERISAAIQTHGLESWSRCFVVLTDRKLRVKRP